MQSCGKDRKSTRGSIHTPTHQTWLLRFYTRLLTKNTNLSRLMDEILHRPPTPPPQTKETRTQPPYPRIQGCHHRGGAGLCPFTPPTFPSDASSILNSGSARGTRMHLPTGAGIRPSTVSCGVLLAQIMAHSMSTADNYFPKLP